MLIGTLDRPALLLLLDGPRTGRATLVGALQPVVVSAVTRVVSRGRNTGRRPLREEVEDITQEVLADLFCDDGRTLRQWAPDRGRDLRGFVHMVAERRALEWMRSASRRGALEDPTDTQDDLAAAAASPEQVISTHDLLEKLLGRLRRELTPKGWIVFHHLFIDDDDIAAASGSLAMQPSALWAWRSRLTARSRALARDLAA